MTDYERTAREMVAIQDRVKNLPTGMSADELLHHQFPPIKWVVPGYIAPGLTILAGSPKMGKSWLILGIACALGVGGCVFSEVWVDPTEVLYLALEDTERRLKERLLRMQAQPSELIHLRVRWPSGQKALETLDYWMMAHPKTRAVFVDTLQRVSGVEDNNNYSETYTAVNGLKQIADKYGIAVVVVHHTSKTVRSDFLHSVMGSVGLTGAADTIIAVERQRGQNIGIMRVTGRDVDEVEIALRFDSDIGTWVRCAMPEGMRPWGGT